MKKLFIASNNKNKIAEIKDIINKNGLSFEILSPNSFNDNEEPEENGNSFKENAFIKASFYLNKYHIPCIADDSGICIDYLGGKPGIHSARFLNNLDYIQKNLYILDLMKYVKNRGAQFVDCICYIDQNGKERYYEGINYGQIATKASGNEGFGYDPIFLIPQYNKTEAELGQKYKNDFSHRAIALKKWIEDIKND